MHLMVQAVDMRMRVIKTLATLLVLRLTMGFLSLSKTYNSIATSTSELRFIQWKYFLPLVVLTGTSSLALASYSPVYDQELETLVQTTPDKALQIAATILNEAPNTNQRLIALYYIAHSNDMLNDLSSTKKAVKQGLLLAKKQQSERFIFEFTTFSVFEYELAGEFVMALKIANQNYQRAIKLDDERLIAISLTTRGQMHLNLSNHQSALKDIEESLTIFKKHNDKINISNSFNTLAIIYADLNDFKKSLKFYKESLNFDGGSSYDKSTIYYNLGTTYLELGDYVTAMKYFQKTINDASKVNDQYTVVFAKNGIADTYLKQKKYNESISMYSNNVKLFKEQNDVQMLFNINLSLAQAYCGKNEFKNALNYLAIAEQYSQKLDNKISKINILRTKEQLFKLQKNWAGAYHALNILTGIEKELNKFNKEKLIQELKIKYNAQFDQEKLELLQSKNDLQVSFIQQQKIKNELFSIIIGLITLLLLMTFYAYHAQKSQRKRLYKLSITDSLTQAYNRRYIVDYLRSLHSQNNSEAIAHSVVMIDLDYFKNINDTFGHEIGNKVLIYFANLVNQHIAQHGKIGRFGGEEWLIILENLTANEVTKLVTRIRKDYKSKIPENIPQNCDPNFSSGILLHAELYQDYDQILQDVDKALYSAKSSGRGKDNIVNQE